MLMRHPKHGHTHVYSIDQQKEHEKEGWILVPDGVPKKEYPESRDSRDSRKNKPLKRKK